jgi:plastocyanin
MSDWDLLTPGIGLTSIGIVGVGISLAGIAKTFIDGMHAVSLLTLFIGLIFLSAGIFKDGFPRSPKAKSATFITLGFLVTFGVAAAVTISTTVPSIFAYIGLMMVVAIPATVIIVVSYKESPYVKAISVIFIAAAVVGGGTFYVFGLVSPKVSSEQDAVQGQAGGENMSTTGGNASSESEASGNASITTGSSSGPVVDVSILPGASSQGNPSYDPAILNVSKGDSIEWTNNDNTPHTVTSSVDEGQTFDSSLLMAGDTFLLETSNLSEDSYDYFCTLHPFMKASFVFERSNTTTANGNQSNMNPPLVTNVSSIKPDSPLTLVQHSDNSLVGMDYTSTILVNKLNGF